MKKMAFVVALALAIFVGITGCDTGTGADPDSPPAVSYSEWWVKGSFDGWSDSPKHFLVIDEVDAKKLTYEITGLYSNASIPLVYEFVLVNPEGVEYKIEGLKDTVTPVTPGTPFVLGDSKATGSTTLANVGFVAAKSSYIVTVDITDAVVPSVNLIAGKVDAPAVTNAMLLDKLEIKGNQFSKINTVAVDAWTATAGTVTGDTMSWDVLVDNKNGEFGFNTLDGWKQGVKPDVTDLDVDASTVSVKLLNDGGNCSLVGMPKSGSVYTITVTVDVTKSVADGRYSLTATYKTAGTADWAFEPWEHVFIAGTVTSWTAGEFVETTNAANVCTYTFKATSVEPEFKIVKANEWGTDLGFSGVLQGTGSLALSDKGGNISFVAVVDSSYTITVTFPASYVADGKPVVTVTLAP